LRFFDLRDRFQVESLSGQQSKLNFDKARGWEGGLAPALFLAADSINQVDKPPPSDTEILASTFAYYDIGATC
jgi:hypothetical protein